jgi:hypothetical protein
MVKTAAAAISQRKAKLNLIKLISGCAARGLTFRKATSQTVYPAMADTNNAAALSLEIPAGTPAFN